jgi:hypothetical protein
MNVPNLPLRVSDDFALTWTWTNADFTARSAQGINNITDFFQACSSGGCYINFHTTSNPGGEIRAQLCPQGERREDANPLYAVNVCAAGR